MYKSTATAADVAARIRRDQRTTAVDFSQFDNATPESQPAECSADASQQMSAVAAANGQSRWNEALDFDLC